jgi:peptidoglycan hydrolase CwlO-like protein
VWGNLIEESAMDKIRAWLSRLSSGSTSSNTTKTQDSDWAARTTRADHVTELQAKVSRLQQEILALSNTAGSSNAQMAALERELDQAQRELAKYQGRI